MNNNLAEIKTILGLSDTSKDELITKLYNNVEGAILIYIGKSTLPTELNFIAIEATVIRYNRLGSEGLTQESIDVVSQTFTEDILDTYKPYLDVYISRNSETSPKRLRMI